MSHHPSTPRPMVADLEDFDHNSGSFVERLIFNNRLLIVILCAMLTVFFGWQASRLDLNANYDGTIPLRDPFMLHYLAHANDLQASGNALSIAVQADHGTIASAAYLSTLQNITNDVLDLPGVNRPFVTSLWTPTTRWTGVVQGGIISGQVISSSYNGSPAAVADVMHNIARTGRVGELVGTDLKSSMVYAPLMNHNGVTGKPLDYAQLARDLRTLRATYQAQGVRLHIVGYAMVVGDMILGIRKILIFFGVSVLIAAGFLYWFTRSGRSTLLVVACTMVAVTWQLGVLPLMGYDLDPYSVLVPFLVFAIGMSHGAQKMNGVMQDIGRGAHPLVAARYTFRRLFLAGFTALICDAVGFGVLLLINIREIRELALIASCGVAILIFTNLILLPVLLSYVGVNRAAAVRSLRYEIADEPGRGYWNFIAGFTRRRRAVPVLAGAMLITLGGYIVGRQAQIGDVGTGAPELRHNSLYNRDARYIQNHYGTGDNKFIIFADSKPYQCSSLPELTTIDRLGWVLEQLPEVKTVASMPKELSWITQVMTDDSPKWDTLIYNQRLINGFAITMPLGQDSLDCSFIPITASLTDLKATTLEKVVKTAQAFIADPANQGAGFKLSLAGGNAGIAAATDRVITRANTYMLVWIYLAVIALCYIAFRSWRAVVCAVVPLFVTSVLCKALMVAMGVGITVATLPVVALGVGIGVDYALYVLGVMMTHLRAGMALEQAYDRSLRFTGRIVMFTGFTLALGVGTWYFAPIKFQADMGLLLAFMFLWNMLGALVLLPALASFLLKPSTL